MIISEFAASFRFRCDGFGGCISEIVFGVYEEATNGSLDGGRLRPVQAPPSCFILWGCSFEVWGLEVRVSFWDMRSLVEGLGLRANSEFSVLGF